MRGNDSALQLGGHLWAHVTPLQIGITLHRDDRRTRPDRLASYQAVCCYDEHQLQFARKPASPACIPLLTIYKYQSKLRSTDRVGSVTAGKQPQSMASTTAEEIIIKHP